MRSPSLCGQTLMPRALIDFHGAALKHAPNEAEALMIAGAGVRSIRSEMNSFQKLRAFIARCGGISPGR